MSSHRASLLVIAPGRSTVRIPISGLWPYELLAVLLGLVLLGVGARHGFEAWRWRAPRPIVRAGELVGSLRRAQREVQRAVVAVARDHRTSSGESHRAHSERVVPRVALASVLSVRAPRARPAAPGNQPAVISAQPILRAFRTRAGFFPPSAAHEPGHGTFLRLHALRLGESVRVQPFDDTGAPQPDAFAAITRLMRCRVTGEEVAIDPRLVRVLTQLAAAYNRPIQLISGHRTTVAKGTSETSQHTTGRAADIRIAGVTIEALRRAAIELGASGVGLYPEKGFVHVDVRQRARFHWIYTEASGEQPYDRFAAAPPLLGAPVPMPSEDAYQNSEDADAHGE
jgi:uncharacterized protein YcbK (DUF882 family)